MKFLIATEPDDRDSVLVKLCLEDMGHQVRLLFTADCPSVQKNSVYLAKQQYRWKSRDPVLTVTDNHYDVVWWRRPRRPHIPENVSHPDDRPFLLRENRLFYESLTDNIAPEAWWVNPKLAGQRANSKLFQLKVAAACGLRCPMTLCSNDADDIVNFVRHHEAEGVIYKPMLTNFWFDEQNYRVSYTNQVSLEQVENQSSLQWTPGIYQKKISKQFELRIICFGNYIVAGKINSQLDPEGALDWRAIPSNRIQIEAYQLAQDQQIKIRQLMKRMGLVFGSLDCIVDEQGELWFLEVNEQGQFLWLEELSQEVKLLDLFVHFLIQRTRYFIWNAKNTVFSVQDYGHEIDQIIARNIQSHVHLNAMEIKQSG